MLPISPSPDKVAVVFPIQPLDGNTPNLHFLFFFGKFSNKFASQQDGNQATERSVDTYVESVFRYTSRCSYPLHLADIVPLSPRFLLLLVSLTCSVYLCTHFCPVPPSSESSSLQKFTWSVKSSIGTTRQEV